MTMAPEQKYWDEELIGFREELIAEGVWNFDVSFEGSEIREIELITEPFYAKATTGWTLDGKDTAEEVQITSFKLRSMSVDLTSVMPGADFSIFNGNQMQVVMKDGEKIPILVRTYFAPLTWISWFTSCFQMAQSCRCLMRRRNTESIIVKGQKDLMHSTRLHQILFADTFGTE